MIVIRILWSAIKFILISFAIYSMCYYTHDIFPAPHDMIVNFIEMLKDLSSNKINL